ncbi:MAG: hypothetical protein WCL32_12100 [Planctomycetota bacterium]|jgi:hypothetical protein
MAPDPIQELRAIREQIMLEFDYDLDKLCDHLNKEGLAEGRVYVAPQPKLLKPGKAAENRKKSTKKRSA